MVHIAAFKHFSSTSSMLLRRLHCRPPSLTRRFLASTSASFDQELQWPVERVRSQFVDYFVSKHSHVNVKSSPCVPLNDPTLLFANAGMNQFKPIFLGTVEPTSPLAALRRVANSQKCIRAGGKHNDLDDVGKDTYHHTFFEMLGTWSFGDYFKKEAIGWAYDLLVNVYGLDPNRLYASYFGGDESLGLPCDNEARDYWLQFLPPERVLPFDKKANFWEMGDTGPCGPCSEIHYDRIGNRDASQLVNADDPDVIEIWNLVFIQFNRESDGSLRTLPSKHIDTGMGLERLTSILQNKRSNYDTDVFQPFFTAIGRAVGCAPYAGLIGEADARQGYRDTAYRVLADHLRTLTFAITDGAVPSNEGRGYVLRRILRRAVRYGMQTLGAQRGFFHQLVPLVPQYFGSAFPELVGKEKEVVAIVKEEEEAFVTLLEKGVKHFNDYIAQLEASSSETKIVDGKQAFYLYDTLGFPIDLTQIMAAERGYQVDMQGFHAAMTEQQERSRLATTQKRLAGRGALALDAEAVATLQKEGVPVTDDRLKYQSDNLAVKTPLQAIFTSTGFHDQVELEAEEVVGIVLAQTTFYGEAGGQVADRGQLRLSEDMILDVIDVQSYGGYVLHTCIVSPLSKKQKVVVQRHSVVEAEVDKQRRRRVTPNHTMTHVLNHVLRQVLPNEAVDQRGSLVDEEKLRFDFASSRGLTVEELMEVERRLNVIIRQSLPVYQDVVPLAQAKAIHGLRAVFGEVYPDPVRVLAIGADLSAVLSTPSLEDWIDYSIEFCGGTHMHNTKEAGEIIIVEESAVARGIRRITALTGDAATAVRSRSHDLLNQISLLEASLSGAKAEDVEKLESASINLRQKLEQEQVSVVAAVQARKQLENIQKHLFSFKKTHLASLVDGVIAKAMDEVLAVVQRGGQRAVFFVPVGTDSKAIKKATEAIRKAAPDLSFLVISDDVDQEKVSVFAVVTEKDLASGLQANQWLATSLEAVGGRGGGKAASAQGSLAYSSSQRGEVMEKIAAAAKSYLFSHSQV
eukprot:gene10133-11215_t